jgi:hypothetical protein
LNDILWPNIPIGIDDYGVSIYKVAGVVFTCWNYNYFDHKWYSLTNTSLYPAVILGFITRASAIALAGKDAYPMSTPHYLEKDVCPKQIMYEFNENT